jgi:putative membrane protein
VAACDRPANTDAGAGTEGAAGTSGRDAAAGLDMGERNFVQDQIKDGTREIELGKLASERASLPAVKEFGQMMVEDHTKAGNDLKEIASRENVELESGDAQDEANDAVEKLSDLRGSEFDREYIDMMVKDHQDAVDALQDQAQNADHAAVKTWASAALPRIKSHLEHAQKLQEQLKNAGNSGQ